MLNTLGAIAILLPLIGPRKRLVPRHIIRLAQRSGAASATAAGRRTEAMMVGAAILFGPPAINRPMRATFLLARLGHGAKPMMRHRCGLGHALACANHRPDSHSAMCPDGCRNSFGSCHRCGWRRQCSFLVCFHYFVPNSTLVIGAGLKRQSSWLFRSLFVHILSSKLAGLSMADARLVFPLGQLSIMLALQFRKLPSTIEPRSTSPPPGLCNTRRRFRIVFADKRPPAIAIIILKGGDATALRLDAAGRQGRP